MRNVATLNIVSTKGPTLNSQTTKRLAPANLAAERIWSMLSYRIALMLVGLATATLTSRSLSPEQSSTAGSANPTFEVASVKPSKSNESPRGMRLQPGGRFAVSGMPLRDLIRFVYGSEAIQTPGQIFGGPTWIGSDRFDIVAKAEGEVVPDASGQPTRLIAMMKALLEDRFKVRVHIETREVQTYALVLSNKDGRLGVQFHPSTLDCAGLDIPSSDPNRWCGIRGGNGNVTAQGVTTAQLALSFANYPVVSRPVRDRTGLTGRYDMHIEFVPAFLDGPNSESQIANPAANSGPSLFTALPEQLGLKLQEEKAAVEVIIIDRAEQPTPD
jgi:uncharacterized protein (TIGR03435 family)